MIGFSRSRGRRALPEPLRPLEQVALLGPAQRVLGGPQVEEAGCLTVPGLFGQMGSYGIDPIVAHQARKVGDCVEVNQGRLRSAYLGQRHDPAQQGHGARGQRQQMVVQRKDLRPVGGGGAGGLTVCGR
jgi:hypothetical protein